MGACTTGGLRPLTPLGTGDTPGRAAASAASPLGAFLWHSSPVALTLRSPASQAWLGRGSGLAAFTLY